MNIIIIANWVEHIHTYCYASFLGLLNCTFYAVYCMSNCINLWSSRTIIKAMKDICVECSWVSHPLKTGPVPCAKERNLKHACLIKLNYNICIRTWSLSGMSACITKRSRNCSTGIYFTCVLGILVLQAPLCVWWTSLLSWNVLDHPAAIPLIIREPLHHGQIILYMSM